MKKTAFIWRESVYKNDFCCSHCGTAVGMSNGEPLGSTLFSESQGLLFCPDCKTVVAKITEIDAPEDMTGKQGNWEDFERQMVN